MEYPKNHGSKWTNEQITNCVNMFNNDSTLENIAETMGRTVSSIKSIQKKYIKFLNATKNISYEELSAKYNIELDKIKEI